MADDKDTSPEQIRAWLIAGADHDRAEAIAEEQAKAEAARAEVERFSSILRASKNPGDFKPGNDPRRLSGGSTSDKSRPKKNLAAYVRDRTNSNADQVDFFVSVASGLIPEATLQDRMKAHEWLANRGAGKAPETVISVDGEDNPLSDLTVEELRSLAADDEKKQ